MKRIAGYVEQFDTQSAQLTVRETVRFSAKLRLDDRYVRLNAVIHVIIAICKNYLKLIRLTLMESFTKRDSHISSNIEKFIDQTLEMLELTLLEHHPVGT